MGGLKDFAITQYMTEISSVKVVTLTLGHPVVVPKIFRSPLGGEVGC